VGLRLFGQKWMGGILSFIATSAASGTPLLMIQVFHIWASYRVNQDE
jgi:hypothetical protein